jgi:DNA repair protein RadD
MKLRPYQIDSIEAVRGELKKGFKRVVLMLPTGSGKSLIAKTIIQKALDNNKKVLFIVDRKTLIDQASKAFNDIPHGIVQADHPCYRPWLPFQICSAQSLMRRKIPDADLVIVDECHSHYDYLSNQMKLWSLVPFIGLTATPFTRGLGNHYETLVNPITTAELIEQGFLVEPVVYAPPTISTKGLKIQAGDYSPIQMDKRVSSVKITADIINTYLEKGEGRKTILFPVNVRHSKELINEFNLAGIPSAHVDAHTPDEERQDIFQDLKDGVIQLISSVGVLTKGFDETSINCVILARPTKSLTLYIQMIGRGLRSHEGQKDCIVLDHAGNVERLGWPDDELPTVLCDGEKTENKTQEENEEKKETELKPKKCPECHFLVESNIFSCPKCGHLFAKRSDIEVEHGELEKLKRVKPEVKRQWYAELLYIAREKGYSEGWCSHKFKEKFDQWPQTKRGVLPSPPSQEVLNYVRYQQIRFAKGKQT